jgi:hypothetical protein
MEVVRADAPLPGWIHLGNATPGGTVLGKILGVDDMPADGTGLIVAFFGGTSLDSFMQLGPPNPVGRGLGEPPVAGTFSLGTYVAPVDAGGEIFLQMRVWSDSGSYEEARGDGKLIGKSKIMKVRTGSELNGAALLSEIGDTKLFSVPTFEPGKFILEDGGTQTWRLNGFPGTYLIEVGDLKGNWNVIETLENLTGSMVFRDSRAAGKGPNGYYRSRLID